MAHVRKSTKQSKERLKECGAVRQSIYTREPIDWTMRKTISRKVHQQRMHK